MEPKETVGDVGEFRLIDRISSLVGDSGAIVGIGDDTAVIEIDGPDYLLATIDMLVESVHYRRAEMPARDLGRRAIAVNISDIAAMGGQPTFALASLAISPLMPAEQIEDVYRGMNDVAGKFGVGIVGGNVSRTDGPFVLDVAVLGTVPRTELILRRGARRGDLLVVSGVLGEAASRRLALDSLTNTPQLTEIGTALGPWIPEPRVAVARSLAQLKIVHAMLDISDGLASDLHHLTDASGVGAVVFADQLPVSTTTRNIARARNLNAVDLALFGGEDYELLMAVPADELQRAQNAANGLPIHVVGKVLDRADGVTLETSSGSREPLPPAGWTHF